MTNLPGGPSPEKFPQRCDRLLACLERRGLQALLVTHPPNIFYLTGFRGSAGALLVAPELSLLWVDPRYTVQARAEARGADVVEARYGLLRAVGRWLDRHPIRIVGYEEQHLTCAGLQTLKQQAKRQHIWKPAGLLLEKLRTVKDETEVAFIRLAGQLTAQVLEEVRLEIRPGVREADLAAEVEYRLRRHGAEGTAFETIVASGERAALPHARASSKPLQKGELVILDLGAILGGYAADMTRTFHVGEARRRARRVYRAVREAQGAALARLRHGAAAWEIDAAARHVLGRYGLSGYFTHSTGHGVGLEVHELPRLGQTVRTKLKAGFVVTVEPGVYIEGCGGVRIEDTVLVTATGCEILTPAPKDPWLAG